MTNFSFESLTQTAASERLNIFAASDSANATQESFETFLQRTTTPVSSEPADREDRTIDKPATSDVNRNEIADSNQDDVRRDEYADETVPTDSAKSPQEDDSERDRSTEDDLVLSSDDRSSDETPDRADVDGTGKSPEEIAAELAGLTAGTDELGTATDDTTEQVAGDKVQAASKKATQSVSNDLLGVDDLQPTDGGDKATADKATGELGTGESERGRQVGQTTVPIDGSSDGTGSPTSKDGRVAVAPRLAVADQPDAASKAFDAAAVDANKLEAAIDASVDDGLTDQRDPQAGDSAAANNNTTATNDASITTAPSRFAQTLLSQSAGPTARTLNISEAGQARFVDRVARAVQATGDRGGTLRIRLSPPELGALTLEVKVQNGNVSARIEAETPAARALLLDNLPALRERLAEQGMRVDQFDVDLSDRHADGTPDGMRQNDQQQDERPPSQTAIPEPEEAAPAAPLIASNTTGHEQLNIIV